jgi:SAM-dependent methyltransferase
MMSADVCAPKAKPPVGFIKRYYRFIILSGLDPLRIVRTVRRLPLYFRNYKAFKKDAEQHKDHVFEWGGLYPCLEDRSARSGTVSGHYFHQDLYVASRIFEQRPVKHVDIGSRVDGFVAHVAAFREIEVLDIRDLQVKIPNITFTRCDFTATDFSMLDYCDSVSCLHSLEHFGLGRYGDTIDYTGHLRGLDNLFRILKPGGRCYLSVPIGPQRVEYDRHRVFSVKYMLRLFDGRFRVDRFSYVDDRGALVSNAPMDSQSIEQNYGCYFGCGIFELTKIG